MKNLFASAGATAVACISLAGCGGPLPVDNAQVQAGTAATTSPLAGARAQTTEINRAARNTVLQPVVVAELVGHYSPTTGRITFERVEEQGPSGGRPLGGYVGLSSNTVSLDGVAVVGTGQSFGTGTCASGNVCAIVTLTNDSSRQIVNPRVEIVDLAAGVTLVGASALGSGYPSTPGNAGGFNYASVNPGSPATKEWRFAPPNSDSFSFNVKVWGTYARTAYSYNGSVGTIAESDNVDAANAAWSDSAPPWRDACLSGSTVLTARSGFDYGLVGLPFPFTHYGQVINPSLGNVWQVTTNGAISLDGVYAGTNTALSSAASNSIFPFWDDLLEIPNGQVCAGLDSTSSSPNRRYVITWKEASLSSYTSSRLSFSVVFQEGTDNLFFLYHRWTTDSAGCASNGTGSTTVRGDSATAGVTGDLTASTTVSVNTVYLPSRLTFATCPGEGAFVALTATATNP